MRVLNEQALKADIETVFSLTIGNSHPKVLTWFKTVWLKELTKMEWFQSQFLHRMKGIDATSRFQGFGAKAALGLEVHIASRKEKIKEFTPYDVKDAIAGTLMWYAPTTYSILHFTYLEELTLVRDYLRHLFTEQPDTDTRRLAFNDVVLSARTWFEAMRRVNLPDYVKRWERLADGKDWSIVFDFYYKDELYRVLRLLTKKALVAESEAMSNCLYTYIEDIYTDKCVIVSIRKATDLAQPILDGEIHTDPFHIVQCRGWHNDWEADKASDPAFRQFTKEKLMSYGEHNVFPQLEKPQEKTTT
jgi:hypothetical protein